MDPLLAKSGTSFFWNRFQKKFSFSTSFFARGLVRHPEYTLPKPGRHGYPPLFLRSK
jgi:hypothetical protein